MWAMQSYLDLAHNSKLKKQRSKQTSKQINPVAQKGLSFFMKEAQFTWECSFPGGPPLAVLWKVLNWYPDHFLTPPAHSCIYLSCGLWRGLCLALRMYLSNNLQLSFATMVHSVWSFNHRDKHFSYCLILWTTAILCHKMTFMSYYK